MLTLGDRHLKKCDLEHVPAHTIEETVMFRIKELSKNKDLLVELAKNNTSQNQKSLRTKESLMYSQLEQLKNIRKDIEGLTQAIARSENKKAQALLIEQLEALSEKKSQLEDEIQALKKEKTQFRENVISAENIFSALKLVNKTLPKLTPRQKKELLSRVIKKIVVYKEGLGVEYFGQNKMSLESGVEAVKSPHSVRLGRKTRVKDKNSYLVDIFNFYSIPTKLDPDYFSKLYDKYQFSLKQISEKMGVSKSTVLEKIRQAQTPTRNLKYSLTNPKNYRAPNPPFGFRVVDGRLVENKREIQLCRKIIEMSDDGLSFNAIAKYFESKELKNRKNTNYWCHKSLKKFYNYWKTKL